MSHVVETHNGRSLYLDNAAAWENNALVSDRLETLQIQSVSYVPTHMPENMQVSTESSLWYAQREREYKLVKQLYTKDERIAFKQLCVFVKTDNLHKRLAGIVMYTPRGNVWFDVTTTCKVTPRGKLGYRKVSESIARELLGVDSSAKVYLQSFKEVLHEQRHRMQEKRRYHGAMRNAPRDRRVGEYMLNGACNYVADSKAIAQTLEDAYLARKWG